MQSWRSGQVHPLLSNSYSVFRDFAVSGVGVGVAVCVGGKRWGHWGSAGDEWG